MSKKLLRIGVLIVVAVMVFGLVSSASAQGPDHHPRGWGERLKLRLFEAVSEATGLSLDDIWQAMHDGQSLTEVLEDSNIDPQPLIEQVKAEIEADIQQAVTDGEITEQRASQWLERLEDLLDRAMNFSWHLGRGHFGDHFEGSFRGHMRHGI